MSDGEMGIIVSFFFIAGMFLGAGFTHTLDEEAWKQQAVEQGYGEYDSQTGDWQWVKKKAEKSLDNGD